MDDIDEFQCEHKRFTRPRARTLTNGSIQYRRQCLDCGAAVGQAVQKTMALERTGNQPHAFDEVLFEQGQAAMEQRRRERWEAESAEWWAWYDEYLQTEEWARKREKVLSRCGGICEGCRDSSASHVHHLTYEHVGAELLFELVGLCHRCHEAAHAEGPMPIPAGMKILELINRREAEKMSVRYEGTGS